MKNIIMSLLILGGLQTVSAAETTYQTAITCEQSDGDQWYSVGLVSTGYSNGGVGTNLVVVYNNTDDGSKKLMADIPVSLKVRGKNKIYSDSFSTMKLVIRNQGQDLVGFLSLIGEVPNSIHQMRMDCFKNSEITFDTQIELEPRLSVGN